MTWLRLRFRRRLKRLRVFRLLCALLLKVILHWVGFRLIAASLTLRIE